MYVVRTFWAPREVSSVKTEGAELGVTTTRAHQMDTLGSKLKQTLISKTLDYVCKPNHKSFIIGYVGTYFCVGSRAT